MDEILLDVSQVSAGYGASGVLHDVTLQIRRGETVAIIGSSGAGKTTLVKSINGLLTPRSGSVRFRGTDVSGRALHARTRAGMATVAEDWMTFLDMTVAENLLAGATFARVKQQMVAISRALMARPKVLILDGPSAGLSPRIIGEIFHYLRSRQRGPAQVRRALAFVGGGYSADSRGTARCSGVDPPLRAQGRRPAAHAARALEPWPSLRELLATPASRRPCSPGCTASAAPVFSEAATSRRS